MTLYEMLARSAEQAPGRIAVRFGDEVFSYENLLRDVNRLGRHLQKIGVSTGDRVVMVLPNTTNRLCSMIGRLNLNNR